MDRIEKLRITLQHWLEHNKGHRQEFEKWRGIMAEDGNSSLANRLVAIINTTDIINEQLGEMLEEVGGSKSLDKKINS